MKLNVRKFLVQWLLISAALALCGCGWVGAVNALWPAITTAVGAIFAFLSNLSVTNPTLAKIQQDVLAALDEAKAVLAQLAQDATATLAQKFSDVLTTIVSSLNALLTALGVTDPTELATITKLVTLALAAIQAVVAIIPLVGVKMTKKELEHADKAVTVNLKNTHKVLQHDYHALVTTQTGNAKVDAALVALPQELP